MAKASERLKALSKEVSSINPNAFDYLLTQIPDQIEKRTRLGKGVECDGAPNKPLEKLSPKYVERRKKLQLFQGATPKRSGLTLTGQMLSSIVGLRKGFSFSFFFSNKEADDKARWATEGSKNRPKRAFFSLSKSERLGIQRGIREVLRERIRSIFK